MSEGAWEECCARISGQAVCRNGFRQTVACWRVAQTPPDCQREDLGPAWVDQDTGRPWRAMDAALKAKEGDTDAG